MAESASQPSVPTHPRMVYRGSLSLLRNVKTYEKHPYDVDAMRESKAWLRSKKRGRKQLQQNWRASAENNPEDIIAGTDFVIFFFFHPRQPHSLRLRAIVAEFREQQKSRVVCVGLYGGKHLDLSSEDEREDVTLFLTGTGFRTIPPKVLVDSDNKDTETDDTGAHACCNLIDFLNVTHIPSVVVIPTATGRPIIGQEIALAWNIAHEEDDTNSSSVAVEALFQRWHVGSSGLSFSQTIMAKTLGDSSSVCCLM